MEPREGSAAFPGISRRVKISGYKRPLFYFRAFLFNLKSKNKKQYKYIYEYITARCARLNALYIIYVCIQAARLIYKGVTDQHITKTLQSNNNRIHQNKSDAPEFCKMILEYKKDLFHHAAIKSVNNKK